VAEPQPNPDLEQRLDPIITEYLEAVERGDSPDPKALIARHPELAHELANFFAAEAEFDRLVSPFRNSSPGTLTSAPTVDGSGTTAPGPMGPLVRSVGDYELLEELGRGGMGVIYKARHRSLNRLVAIKMIRSAEWATPDERLRFRWEAETVATLDHPNIVPIFEVGEVTSEGVRLPYFSMKLIEGENLAHARARFRNDWASIARLLSLITRAVEHAHHRGVLHRDLKPANVLLRISAQGVPNEELQRGSGFVLGGSFVTPHISDFGLARRTHAPRGGTMPGAIIGTPSYLAPELTKGHEFATSGSDVYSLGAILYELLTGFPPFQGETPLETIRLVADGTVTPPHKRNPAVPPDLETICLKCLESDPGKRYSSAAALAEDLEHFLAHRPITARPVGRFERFGRWCRRQPVIAGLSAALVLVVLGSLPLIVWNWRRALHQEAIAERRLGETELERDRANQEKDRAIEQGAIAERRRVETEHEQKRANQERDRADDAFTLAYRATADVFRALADDPGDGAPGADRTRRELLENGLNYYRTFAARHRDDPKMRREVAQALFQCGKIAGRIGPHSVAVESYRTAISLLRALVKEHPEDHALRELLGMSLGNMGGSLNVLNQLDEALAAYEEGGAVWAQLEKDRQNDSRPVSEQASAWMNRGVALQGTQDWGRVLESFERGLAILRDRRLDATEPHLMVKLLSNIAQAEDRLGRTEDALKSAREAQRIAEARAKAAPRSEDARLQAAYAARAVGILERKGGALPAARTNLERTQKVLDEFHALYPRVTEYAWNLSFAHEDLAHLAEKEQRPRDAVKELVRAESLMMDLVKREPDSHPNRSSLARIEDHLGQLYQGLGDYEATRKAYLLAKVHMEYLLAHNSPRPGLRFELAQICQQLGAISGDRLRKWPEALAAAEEAAKHYSAMLERDPKDQSALRGLIAVVGNRAIAHRRLGKLPEALSATEERVRLAANNPVRLFDAAGDFAQTYEQASRAKGPDPKVLDRALKDALDALRQALRAGFTEHEKLRTDKRFTAMRDTPEFQALLNEIANPNP
jgi:serine/threonine-protein kinase